MESKIERKFAGQEAYLRLQKWILEGTLPPGTKLLDKELALQLGVSRTPVREALQKLEKEGLIETKPNRSTTVSLIKLEEAFELYSIVWTLEKLALSQAYESITQKHIEEMENANKRLLEKMNQQDLLASLEADYAFHAIYIELSKNKELEKLLNELKAKLKRIDLYYFKNVHQRELSYEEHERIIRALKSKDLPLALAGIELNWKNSFYRFNIESPHA